MKELPPEPVAQAVTTIAAGRRGLTETRLRSLLTGDLSTIVAKCLTPRPRDRYASVDALMADVQRYLGGRPILARAQTTTYRISKFVRRNRKSVLAGALACFALAASLAYAAWRQHQAVLAGERAERVQNFMYQLFKLANSNYMGKPAATVPEFLQLGAKVLPDFIKDPADQRAAQLSLAESMFDNSDYIHAEPVFMQVIASAKAAGDVGSEAEAEGFEGTIAFRLGRTEQSRELESDALALSHKPGVTPSARVSIENFYANDRDSSGFRTEENVKLLEAALSESRSAHLPQREQAAAMMNLAALLVFRGESNRSESLVNEALAIYQKEPYGLCDQSDVNYFLGNLRYTRGDYAGSLPLYREAQAGYATCSGPDNQNTLALDIFVARTELKLGQAQPAIRTLEEVLPRERASGSPRGPNVIAPLVMLARAYVMDGQFAKAEPTIREAMKLQQGTFNSHSAQIAAAELVLAQSLNGQGRFSDALAQAESADKIYAGISTLTPGEKEYAAQAHALLLGLQARVASSTAGGGVLSKEKK
jgi:tetratricopeptide (TPR) repeat protein